MISEQKKQHWAVGHPLYNKMKGDLKQFVNILTPYCELSYLEQKSAQKDEKKHEVQVSLL